MDYKKEVVTTINEINKIFDDFCGKIAHEHHKGKDGIWEIQFSRWNDNHEISHNGYWLDEIWVESKDLLEGLKIFKDKLKKRIDEEISNYDFEKHCGKEII